MNLRISNLVVVCLMLAFMTSQASASPHTVVVLCEGLTADSLRDSRLPHIRALAEEGSVALMNTAVAGPQTPASALLTMAVGEYVASEDSDAGTYSPNEPLENGTALDAFKRRTGTSDPSDLSDCILLLNAASLRRRSIDQLAVGSQMDRAGQSNAVSTVIAANPGEIGRIAALFSVNRTATIARGKFLPSSSDAATLVKAVEEANSAIVILYICGEAPTRDASLQRLDEILRRIVGYIRPDRLLVVSTCPSVSPTMSVNRLALAVFVEKGDGNGLLTSATTRTPGLVANVDIAPTLLAYMNIAPPATMVGHRIYIVPSSSNIQDIANLDAVTTINGRALFPTFITIGLIGVLITVLALAFFATKNHLAPVFANGILFMFGMPLGLLLASPCAGRLMQMNGHTAVALYTLVILAVMAISAVGSTFINRYIQSGNEMDGPAERLRTLALLTILVLIADSAFGFPLVKYALFSSFQLQGIRFYGIGNEYVAILTGFSLLWIFLSEERKSWRACLLLVLAVIVGYPRMGAKAGGFITLFTAFGLTWGMLKNGRATITSALMWSVAGFCGTFLLAGLDNLLPGSSVSHLGAALKASNSLGSGYLLNIAARKIAMNARILIHPAMLVSLLIALALYVVLKHTHVASADTPASKRQHLQKSVPVFVLTGLAALVYNDSGAVSAIFIIGSLLVANLYFLLADAGT